MARETVATSRPDIVVAGSCAGQLEEEGYPVLDEVSDEAGLLALLDNVDPDVLLLDLSIASDPLALLDDIDTRAPATEVVAVGPSEDPAVVAAVFQRGARAYVVKSPDPLRLGPAIRCALMAARAARVTA